MGANARALDDEATEKLNIIEAALPINRLSNQFIRDGHLTFKSKCRDLVMQIYGHEGLIDNSDTANIAKCDYDFEFYRMRPIKWKHLALRKLLNPFKYIEFLIVTPFELLNWSLQRSINILMHKNTILDILNSKSRWGYLVIFCLAISSLLSFTLNLTTNIFTGIVRRFLAPVRYIIRPAIETAIKYPGTFLTIFALTLSITMFLATTMLTAGVLPVMIASHLLGSSSAAMQLFSIGMLGLSLGNFLTKGFNTICDMVNGFISIVKRPSKSRQLEGLDGRRQQLDYSIKLLKTKERIDIEILDQKYQEHLPILIEQIDKGDHNIYMYGRSITGKTQLKQLYYDDFSSLFKEVSTDKITRLLSSNMSRNDDNAINEYRFINYSKAHYPEKIGATEKITETYHAINVDNVDIKAIKDQDSLHQTALFFGVETLFYRKKPGSKSADQMTAKLVYDKNKEGQNLAKAEAKAKADEDDARYESWDIGY